MRNKELKLVTKRAGNVFKIGDIVLELSNGSDPRFSKANSFEMSAKALGHELKSFSAIEDAERLSNVELIDFV